MNLPQHLETPRRSPIAMVMFGGVGAILLVTSAALHNSHLALASVPAFALCITACLWRPVKRCGMIDETGLHMTSPSVDIPYESIESLTLKNLPQDPTGPLKAGPLVIMHSEGILEIPKNIEPPVLELYSHLSSRIGGAGSSNVHPDLASYATKEIELFGEDRVWTFCARQHFGRPAVSPGALQFFTALMITGVIWGFLPLLFAIGSAGSQTFWSVVGWVSFGLGMLCLIGTPSGRGNVKPRVPNWRESSLVVSPSGIAMRQGDLQGQMRWDELQQVNLKVMRLGFAVDARSLAMQNCLQLVVVGAVIGIADIYDRPLPYIANVIRYLWRPADAAQNPA